MYTEFIFRPLYNGLVLLMNIPGIDLGLAVILFTIIIRFILYPLSKSALLTQVRMKNVEPEANKIKAQYANDRTVQGQKLMQLYKEKGIHPLSGILLLFLQLPILLALISVFYGIIPHVQPALLYSFVPLPVANNTLLGLDLSQKSLILALITGIVQFCQLQFSLAAQQQKESIAKGNVPTDAASKMAASMTTQMKFFLPILAFASIYWIIPAKFPQASSIIAIYWSVSALFTLGQELFVRKRYLSKGTKQKKA